MKRHSFKNITVILLSAVLLLACLAVPAFAEQYGNFSYTINEPENDETFESYNVLTGYSRDKASNETAIAIPDVIEKIPVTEIGAGAFKDNNTVEDVIIPDTVKTISNAAFENCSVLKVVVIPDSVEFIGDSAFQNCPNLKYVIIGNGVKDIGDICFKNCTSLEYLSMGASVSIIGNGAFFGCTSLKNIYLPSSVTSIGDMAFGFQQNKDYPKSIDGVKFYAASQVDALNTYLSKKVITGYETKEGATAEDVTSADVQAVYAEFPSVTYVEDCGDGNHDLNWVKVRTASDSYDGLSVAQCSKCFAVLQKTDKDIPAAESNTSGLILFIVIIVLVLGFAALVIIYVKSSKRRRAKAIAEYREQNPEEAKKLDEQAAERAKAEEAKKAAKAEKKNNDDDEVKEEKPKAEAKK